MSKKHFSRKFVASAVVAAALFGGLIVASPASAHVGYAGNFATKADCDENRRVMERSGHVTQACTSYPAAGGIGGVKWVHFYGH